LSLKRICRLVQDDQYRLTRHARDASRVRRISVVDIEDAIINGQVIETHLDDWGFVCYLIAGERFNGDVIHVACKIVDDVVQINTVYFPYVHLWEDDRVRRR